LGIALASGAPLISGLIAGVIGGLVVAPLSNSALGVSGPAAGLAVIVLNAIDALPSFNYFLAAVVYCGLFQIVLGILKSGVIGYYFPSSVIKGMLSAIGIIIILKQIPHAFGYDSDPEGELEFIQSDGYNTFSELVHMFSQITPAAVLISLVSILILILWEQKIIKRNAFLNAIPAPLLVVLLGIGLSQGLPKLLGWELSQEHLVFLPVSETVMDFFGQFSVPVVSAFWDLAVVKIGFTMAIIASLETLLCVEATDKLDPMKRITSANKELYAQGVGNVVSGLIGGIPITQVIVRSSANIQSGGKTKASAFLHGLWLLLSAVFIPTVLNRIPLSALAGILLMVGYKLAKPSMFKAMYVRGKSEFIPFITTIVAIVFTDLLIGILIGLVIAVFYILWDNYNLPYKFNWSTHVPGDPIEIEFSESVSFLNKASIQHTFNKIPNGSTVKLNATNTLRLHPDVLEIIEEFETNAQFRDISIERIGFEPTVEKMPWKQFE
jgi:MFS superfamily sulfate permease-like transporter